MWTAWPRRKALGRPPGPGGPRPRRRGLEGGAGFGGCAGPGELGVGGGGGGGGGVVPWKWSQTLRTLEQFCPTQCQFSGVPKEPALSFLLATVEASQKEKGEALFNWLRVRKLLEMGPPLLGDLRCPCGLQMCQKGSP